MLSGRLEEAHSLAERALAQVGGVGSPVAGA
jgi:hypothetical protein